MVTIQPFEYEKTTAFKERVQIANKVNEIISLFNELDIESKINIFNEEIVIINGKITEINNALNEVNTAVNTVEGYNARLTSVENESISLDARLDNIEPVVSSNTAKIGVLENKDLENVKLSGNQTIENIKTFSNSPIVPNPPSGDTSTKAVNTNWVSQTGDNAPNNIVHKTGNETILGLKKYENIQAPNTIQRNNNYLCEKNKWCKMLTFPIGTSRNYIFIFTSVRGAWPCFGMLHVENDYGGLPRAYWIVRKYNNEINSTFNTANSIAITSGLTEGRYDLWIKGNQAAVNGGVFIAVDSMIPINDVNYPSEPQYVDDITQVGATNIYYAEDYPNGL